MESGSTCGRSNLGVWWFCRQKSVTERRGGIVMARVKPQAMLIVLSLAVIVLTAMVLGIDRVPGLGVVALAGALTKLVEKD
tara:strand:+ start:367 stop:609 length:243 start_codon:yes stop_codon:yes gene_type:complete